MRKQPISEQHQAAVAHHLRVGGYDPYNSLDTQVVISWELEPLDLPEPTDPWAANGYR